MRETQINPNIMNTTETILGLTEKVKEARTYNVDARQLIAKSSKELYNMIEEGLYSKYGDNAVKSAYSDLVEGNFADPFMCEKQKETFVLYASIYIDNIV